MASLNDLKFLVVDDMLTMRKILSNQLRSHGITNITEADGGTKAYEFLEAAANSAPFQFIVSDWNMPDMPGLELLKKCRAHPIYKDIAFLMVTAEADVGQVKTAIMSGVDNYVVKPFTPAGLIEKIQLVFNKRFK